MFLNLFIVVNYRQLIILYFNSCAYVLILLFMMSRLSLHTIYCAVSTIYFVSPGPVYTRSFHKQTTLARHQVSAKMLLFSRLQFSHLRCTVHCQLNVSRQIPLWQTKSISKFNTWIREGSKKSALKCVL